MTKLEWEKRNSSELVVKRLNQYLDNQIVDPSDHEALLKACGFPPSLEAIEILRTSLTVLRKMTNEVRTTVDRCSEFQTERKREVKAMFDKELKDLYAQILVLRLAALYPARLGME